ncbi:hypothetical protein E3P88_02940 [Wallemia ichthyophaga]|nr:hypothetical protein E3P93_02928 [Wallemia ichthyophaga]TIB22617.1 hypothetical protein E3P88_02940 [Wallemia ichthyophaga]
MNKTEPTRSQSNLSELLRVNGVRQTPTQADAQIHVPAHAHAHPPTRTHKHTTLKLDKLPRFTLGDRQDTEDTDDTEGTYDTHESWLSFIPRETQSTSEYSNPPPPPSLLPKSLWKPDNDSLECDMVTCSTTFNLLERRHHCRKCGGVFCNPHSSQTANLVDTTSCDYILPRRQDKSKTVAVRHPTTPQLSISPFTSSSFSSPSCSLGKHYQQQYQQQYHRMTSLQLQHNSYFVPPMVLAEQKCDGQGESQVQVQSNSQSNSHSHSQQPPPPLHNYVLASTSARQAPGRLAPFTPPITSSHSTYTSSLNIPIKSSNHQNVIIDGDIKVKEQPIYGMGQSLAKSLTWAWSTF